MDMKTYRRLIEEEDARYMREEGEEIYQQYILPELKKYEPELKRKRRKVVLGCMIAALLAVSLTVAGLYSCENFYQLGSRIRWTTVEALNSALEEAEIVAGEAEVKAYYDKGWDKILMYELQIVTDSALIEMKISVSNDYQPSLTSDLQQTEYLGWELRYRIVQENKFKDGIKFSAYGELYTGEEEIYLNYEQISTDGQCNFFGFLEQTVAKKGESASILAQ